MTILSPINMEESEDDDNIALKEKIDAPIVWYENPKFQIIDLRDNHFEEVLTLIKRHYFTEDHICKSFGLLEDSISVKAYMDLIRSWMNDMCSLVVISKKSGRVVGAAINKINSLQEKTETYSRIQMLEGEALQSIIHLKNTLVKQSSIYERLKVDEYLEICLFIVHYSYKIKLGHALLDSCRFLASSMQVPLASGIFSSNEDQTMAEKSGFTLLSDIPCDNWIVNEEVVRHDPGTGNCSAALMVSFASTEKNL